MEPDKSYQLHSDQNDQSSTPSTPPVNPKTSRSLAPPSTYSPPQDTAPTQPAAVPWYLKPLTKTTASPLTSTQTRPFVPREPLPPNQQQYQPPQQSAVRQPLASETGNSRQLPQPQSEEPASPFRSQPLPPIRSPHAASPQQSVYRQPPPPPRPMYQQQSVTAPEPTPFSQFSVGSAPQSVNSEPRKKSGKVRRIIGIAIAVLLVGAIGFGAYSLWRGVKNGTAPVPGLLTGTAENRLHQAIEKQLQTRYVRQVFEQTIGDGSELIKLDATSDFSDPRAPKTHILYDSKLGKGEAAVQYAGEIIVLDNKEYFGKLAKPVVSNQGDERSKPKENQWYQVADGDAVGGALMDPLSVRKGLNSPVGEMPVGNFSDTTRQELIKLIKDRQVYKIKDTTEITEQNEKQTHYNIEFNASLVNELNKKIAEASGSPDDAALVTFENNDVKNMEIWVSNNTGRLTKIKFLREYAAIKETITISLSYPSDISVIKKPESPAAGTWTSQR
jgi:hypothetical protein